MLIQPLLRRQALAAFTKPLTKRPLSSSSLLRSPLLRSLRPAPKLQTPTQSLAARRFFTTEQAVIRRPNSAETWQRLASGALLFGGTLFATNFLFNRETREGSIPAYEHEYLKETFTYTALGVGIIGAVAKGLHNVGFAHRLMMTNPWLVMGGGLVASIGTLAGVYSTDPDNYGTKHAFWAAFNVCNGALLAPMFFYSPAILARAGLYTIGVMGSISYVAATAREDRYLYLGGPLLAGCAVVALSGLAPLVLPLGSRALVGAEALWLYGGLAVFGGFTLYDVQKIMHNARLAQAGVIKKDTVKESISLELDFINIFVRMVQILANRQQNRR
ncbi:inhibitor of apoptosis-promoting Bax1-domain-containing protein [Geopyxis carbonaria]|nr:inhibitor of apoptosis-promoting Bax1-domain-containing protein [Geopyxis carbonaria]